MALKVIQKQVDKWASQYEVKYWKPMEIMLRLIEEVGELAREVNHQFGPKKKKLDEAQGGVKEEISDMIFTLVCLSNSLSIDLDKAFEVTMDKYKKRDKNRFKLKIPLRGFMRSD